MEFMSGGMVTDTKENGEHACEMETVLTFFQMVTNTLDSIDTAIQMVSVNTSG